MIASFAQRYAQLNAEQKRAVDTIEGAVLVVAGPGSGKTEVLTLRVAQILQQTDIGPTGILCLTFTDAAASTMRTRLASLIGQDAYRVQIGTFHAFAQLVAEQYPLYFAGGAELTPADALVQRELLTRALEHLPISDPLRGVGPTGDLIYLSDAAARIADLKKAGISPETFASMVAHTAAVLPAITDTLSVFAETVNKKKLPEYAAAAEALMGLAREPFPRRSERDLAQALGRSLEQAVLAAETEDSSTPITTWKKDHFVAGEFTLRTAKHLPRLQSLAQVYAVYRDALRAQGLRDFDDLVIDLVDGLRDNPTLRAELQEEYQYILVDEYQDTNGAQSELLTLLADHPTAEGNPNLMVVGDDDQAIYRFHGAGLEHLLSFVERYPRATVITMATNYRSHQAILDLSGTQIRTATERLEGRLPGLTKVLTQGGAHTEATLAMMSADSREQERGSIAALVQEIIARGVPPHEIAVIGRRNSDLMALAPYLAAAGIVVSYDRQRDALDDPRITMLLETARVCTAISQGDAGAADVLLPRVLAFPWWGIARSDLWQVAREAHTTKTPWLDVMLTSEVAPIRDAAAFLIDLGTRALHDSAEQLIDELVGTVATPEGRQSPFHGYYLTPAARTDYPEELLAFTAALRAVVRTLRLTQRDTTLYLHDVIAMTDTRRAHHEPITTSLTPHTQGVHLLTAHKAKGREFDVVIIMHAATDVWHGRGRASLITFPENMPFSPAGDSLDDQLRTLFVAITRARHTLYFATSPSDTGRRSELLAILQGLPTYAVTTPVPLPPTLAWSAQQMSVSAGEMAVLQPFVAEMRLTPTQLNDFLDLIHGGPEVFFERHVLRFPQQVSPQLRFGNAVHATLEWAVLEGRRHAFPDDAAIREYLDRALQTAGMTGDTLHQYLVHGGDALTKYCAEHRDDLRSATHVEVSFSRDRVVLGDAPITGKADVITETPDGLVIVDYKTGAGTSDWDDRQKAAQWYGYRRQLLFYVLLAKHAPRFAHLPVAEVRLSFVIPDAKGVFHTLSLVPSDDELVRTERLIQEVSLLIRTLAFPDVSEYSKDLAGIQAFEEDILTRKTKRA